LAATNAIEFVSEVFAALMTDQDVTRRARGLYDLLAPPSLR
jgi:hypothetical protein